MWNEKTQIDDFPRTLAFASVVRKRSSLGRVSSHGDALKHPHDIVNNDGDHGQAQQASARPSDPGQDGCLFRGEWKRAWKKGENLPEVF